MATAMIILYVLQFQLVFFAYDIFVGTEQIFGVILFIHPQHFKNDIEFIAFDIKLIPVIFIIFSLCSRIYFYYLKPNFYLLSFLTCSIYYFFLNYKWFFDPI
jgi:hypothetical protein